jgi:uncharacterized OB-fold protein
MTVGIPVCTSCGAAVFPPRALCPRCAAREWRLESVDRSTIVGVTAGEGTRVASVQTPLGPILVVRLLGDATTGDEVDLAQEGTVIVGRVRSGA